MIGRILRRPWLMVTCAIALLLLGGAIWWWAAGHSSRRADYLMAQFRKTRDSRAAEDLGDMIGSSAAPPEKCNEALRLLLEPDISYHSFYFPDERISISVNSHLPPTGTLGGYFYYSWSWQSEPPESHREFLQGRSQGWGYGFSHEAAPPGIHRVLFRVGCKLWPLRGGQVLTRSHGGGGTRLPLIGIVVSHERTYNVVEGGHLDTKQPPVCSAEIEIPLTMSVAPKQTLGQPTWTVMSPREHYKASVARSGPVVHGVPAAGKPEPGTTVAEAILIEQRNKGHFSSLYLHGEGVTDDGIAELKNAVEITHLEFANCPRLTDAGLKRLTACPRLRTLELHNCPNVTDAGLAHLEELSQLSILRIEKCSQLTDAVFSHLGKIKTLDSLSISACPNITGAGADQLRENNHLREISFYECPRVGDAALECVSEIATLQNLYVGGSAVSDKGAEALAKMDTLRILGLRNSAITDAGLAQIARMRGLRELNLTGCANITDTGMPCLKEMSSLERLQLGDCTYLTDAGAEQLGSLTGLHELNLSNTMVTDGEIADLEEALPKARISGGR
jgi:hypothetical protein